MYPITSFLLILVFVPILSSRDQKPISSAIIAKQHRYPFIVIIEIKDDPKNPICTGSLINPRVVVTTAFCIGNNWREIINKLTVTAGSQYLPTRDQNGTQQRKVMSRVPHPRYREEYLFNDIAVLLLRKPFNIKKNSNVRTISLNFEKLGDGMPCESIGWGLQNDKANSNLSNTPLKSIKVHVYNPEFCDFMFQVRVAPGQACTERPSLYADVCSVDIGSPLVCNNMLAGVASKIANCTNIQEPNVYTLVAYYNGFIHYAVDPLELESCSLLKASWILCVIGNFLTESVFLLFKMI